MERGQSVSWEIRQGDALECLSEMPDESVQCCVTSPPYFGLRDYGIDGQIGLESTPDEFVARLVDVFREVRRVLRDDGTLWLVIGDSYCGAGYANHAINGPEWYEAATLDKRSDRQQALKKALGGLGIKPKDLIGIPWLLAFALRADGWYLRSDVIWAKPNPMPESVTDRPTNAHEHLFLLAKSRTYYYDADAIREPSANPEWTAAALEGRWKRSAINKNAPERNDAASVAEGVPYAARINPDGRNKRNVWEIATQPYAEAHFATFPPRLVEPCILAGCPEGGVVLDPFAGAGTTGLVALRRDRSFVGIELNPAYAEMARERIRRDAPLLNTTAEVAA